MPDGQGTMDSVVSYLKDNNPGYDIEEKAGTSGCGYSINDGQLSISIDIRPAVQEYIGKLDEDARLELAGMTRKQIVSAYFQAMSKKDIIKTFMDMNSLDPETVIWELGKKLTADRLSDIFFRLAAERGNRKKRGRKKKTAA